MGSHSIWKRLLDWFAALPVRLAYRLIWLTAKLGSRNAKDVSNAMWNAGLNIPRASTDLLRGDRS